jgi:hypothetical protein
MRGHARFAWFLLGAYVGAGYVYLSQWLGAR